MEFRPIITFFPYFGAVNNLHEEIILLMIQWQFQSRNKKHGRGTNNSRLWFLLRDGVRITYKLKKYTGPSLILEEPDLGDEGGAG